MRGGGEGRHSQVGGDGVPVRLPHGQHEVGDPVHQACLVLIVLAMPLRHLQPNQGRQDRSLVRGSDRGRLLPARLYLGRELGLLPSCPQRRVPSWVPS